MIKTVLQQHENIFDLNKKEGLKAMKKILSTILVAAMLLSTMGMVAFAEVLYVDANATDSVTYTSLAEAAKNAQNGDTIILAGGEYDATGVDFGTVTVKAADNATVTIDVPDNPANSLPLTDQNANVTFENVILDFYPNGNYNGLQYNTVTYNSCIINGQIFLYAYTSDTFNNCTFNQNSKDAYNVWTYTSNKATFNNCTFNCAGKGLLVYNEGHTSDVAINDSTFIATEEIEGKAAIEISAAGGATYVNVDNNTTSTGFASGSISGNSLWNVKDKTTPNNTLVTVGENIVHAELKNSSAPVVAIIGNELFSSFSDAVSAAASKTGDVTITLKDNVEWETGAGIGSTPLVPEDSTAVVTIEGMDKTITATGKGVGAIRAANNTVLTFKNVNFVDESVSYVENSWEYGYLEFGGKLSFNGCDFTGAIQLEGEEASFANCTFQSTKDSEYAVWVCDGATSFNGCSFTGARGLKAHEAYGSEIASLSASNCSFTGLTKKPAIALGTLNEETSVSVSDCTITDVQAGDQGVYLLESDTDLSTFNFTATGNTITVAGEEITPMVEMNGKAYSTLNEAVMAAEDNAVIDLKGNTVTPQNTQMNVKKNITIKGGTIDLSGVNIPSNAIWQVDKDATITFDGITVKGENYDSAYGVVYLVSNNAGVVFKGCMVDLDADGKSGGFVKGEGYMGTVIIDDCDITLEDTTRGFITTDVTIMNDSFVSIACVDSTNFENAVNRCALAVKDTSVLDIKGCTEYGIKVSDKPVTISDTARVTVTGSGIADIAHADANATGVITVDKDATLEAGKIALNENATVNGEIVSKADIIYVQFEKKDDDSIEREKDIYDIVLVGYADETINELASADLTFAFDGTKAVNDGDMSYAITSAEGVTLSQVQGQPDRFMFNYNGVDKWEVTDKKIVLGQVTINGYGEYTFGVNNTAAVTTNAVYATEIRNNIVDGFTPAADLVLNEDMDTTDTLVGEIKAEISVPVQKLTINVTFPNAVTTTNKELYQDMQVKIEGGNVKKTIALGNERDEIEGATVTAGDGFVVEINLPYNTTYTVTVSGAGYRTATYSVVLTGDKELTFWNNVMDDDKEIEKDNANSVTKKNFLAGDIVKDNKINIYDLSAVVSYFGQIDLNKTPGGEDFAKYDLDRDGKIDAKDVAYVLVSWGN